MVSWLYFSSLPHNQYIINPQPSVTETFPLIILEKSKKRLVIIFEYNNKSYKYLTISHKQSTLITIPISLQILGKAGTRY